MQSDQLVMLIGRYGGVKASGFCLLYFVKCDRVNGNRIKEGEGRREKRVVLIIRLKIEV